MVTQTSRYSLPEDVFIRKHLLIISLSGQPAASETQDSASWALYGKFRNPLATSGHSWSQWGTDEGKKGQSSKRHIRFLLLGNSMTMISRDPIFFPMIPNMKIKWIHCFSIDIAKLSLVCGPLLFAWECVHIWVILSIRERFTVFFVAVHPDLKKHTVLITHISFDSFGACCDTCGPIYIRYTHIQYNRFFLYTKGFLC